MENLQALFIEEAEELIVKLESALLNFERDLGNRGSIEEIFRAMHTLKGSASMFGFDSLSNLTHDLETVYDAIRDNRREATAQILEVTLRTTDHIKEILKDQNLGDTTNRETHEALLKDIKALNEYSHDSVRELKSGPVEIKTYYVSFCPANDIFKSGSNPLFLVDDLVALGEALVIPYFKPELFSTNICEDQCYTSFEVILAGTVSEMEIREVFLFVEGNAEVIIHFLAKGNLLKEPAFTKALAGDQSLRKMSFGFDSVKAIAENVRAVPMASSALTQSLNRMETATSIRVSSEKLDELMNLVSELVTSQARLALLAEQQGIADLNVVSENIEKITRRLRDNAFSICLVQVETVVTRFQRLIRDLSKELNKDVVFVAEGTETELDKSLIEKITDPILHILRNCIDHGIESPEERVAKGKSPQGKIHFKAFHSGATVHLEISDDGRGIDAARIKAKAVSKGLILEDTILTEKDIMDLVFTAGFSTAEKITDVSGRGVGMDVVKRNIDAIHGDVDLQSEKNKGTTFTIRLPMTLSIMDGMLVKIASSDYIIPLTAVDKCYEIDTRTLTSEISQRVVLDGSLVPVFNLRQAFAEEPSQSPITQIVKLNYNDFPVGVTVDTVVGEYQAVMKPLGDLYQTQEEFSGATILGDGSVALVVDINKFIRQLMNNNETKN
jgi:two-component system chemotaxis sensor kinase CheA